MIRKDVSIDKIKRQPIHIDFLALDMQTEIRVNLEIVFKGIPKGVKEEGGVFNITLRTVEVECLPNKIPESLEIDVSDLGLNEALHVFDLQISKDLKLVTKSKRTLCTVVNIEEEKEESPAEATTTVATTDDVVTPVSDTAKAPAGDPKKKASK